MTSACTIAACVYTENLGRGDAAMAELRPEGCCCSESAFAYEASMIEFLHVTQRSFSHSASRVNYPACLDY
jgi:hypothetical protein